MRLSSQNSQFIFNLPSDFIPREIIQTYQPLLEKNWIQYENVLDYLNSTITSVDFPGISFTTPEQTLIRGKKRNYKPATNVQDILSQREITLNFRSVDADLNYWILFDIVTKHYLDVDNLFINPLTIKAVDIHRDEIYAISFYEVISTTISNNAFDYSSQRVQKKEFTMTLKFNFIDFQFSMNKSKILELGSVPKIIQKL
jgi:hypothetical protein